MKKIVLTLFIILGIIVSLPTVTSIQAKSIDTNKNISLNKTEIKNNISIVITYNNFDEMIKAGERIFYKNNDFSGYLLFQSANRIENTKKFTVVYVNEINNK